MSPRPRKLLLAMHISVSVGWTMFGRRASEIAPASGYHDPVGGKIRSRTAGIPRWAHALWIHAVVLLVLFSILHLAGGGPAHH